MEQGGSLSSCYNSVQGRGHICHYDFIEFNNDYLGSEPVVAKVQRYWIDVSSSKT